MKDTRNYYKLYLKAHEVYQPPEIYYSKKKLDERLASLDSEYLLIHRHDGYDDIVSHHEAKVKFVDEVKSNVKIQAKVFNTEELKRKRKMRKEEKRKLQKEMEEYIDR